MKKYVLDIIAEAKRQMNLPPDKRDSTILTLATQALSDHSALLEEMLTEQNEKLTKLQQDILIDPLTGLYTRRGLERYLEKIDKNKEYGLFLADVSGLKAVNDNFGMSVGDYIIRSAAFGIRSSLKAEDFICRYGFSHSDEFLIITNNCKNNFEIAQRISCIETSLFDKPYQINMHVSRGVYNPEHESFSDAFSRVDKKVKK